MYQVHCKMYQVHCTRYIGTLHYVPGTLYNVPGTLYLQLLLCDRSDPEMLPLLDPATDTPLDLVDTIGGKLKEVDEDKSFEAFAGCSVVSNEDFAGCSVVSIEVFACSVVLIEAFAAGGSGRKPPLWIGELVEADKVSDDDVGDTTRSMSMKRLKKLRQYHTTKQQQCDHSIHI